MARKLRWALLSTARINEALIPPLKRAARSELVAVASRDGARGSAYATKWDIPRVFDSYDALLADPDIDVIYNSLPNSLHAPWTVLAAQAGKHVLCEKPMVVSLAEMDAIESATAASGVTVFEAFMYLHHPQTLRVIELIRSGRIGQMQEIQSWFQYYLPPTDSSNVRLLADLTGGAHWDVGVYPNSFSIVATGGKAPLDVWAQSLIGETGVDVGMRAQLRFANGVTSQISCGFRTPFREAAWFVGDQGIIHVAEPWKPGFLGQESRITLSDRNDRVETIVIPPTDPYDCEVAAMEACVLDGAAPVVPLGLSREFAKSILAAYSSAATGLLTVP